MKKINIIEGRMPSEVQYEVNRFIEGCNVIDISVVTMKNSFSGYQNLVATIVYEEDEE